MPSSLGVLRELLNRNLLHSGDEWATFDAANANDLERLIRAVDPWLIPMTQAVVAADLDEVTMKGVAIASDEADAQGGPRIKLKPGTPDPPLFFTELVTAFAQLEPLRPHPVIGSPRPHPVTQRLAAAALTAHARLCDASLVPLAVSPSALQEEDLMAVEAGVAAVLQLMPGDTLIVLPEHLQCAKQAVQNVISQIRQADTVLGTLPAPSRRVADAAVTDAREGLYFLASASLKMRYQGQRVSLKAERCPEVFTLLRGCVGFDQVEAERAMHRFRIWKSPPDKSGVYVGAITPNHENVLSLRGFVRFYIELAREWQARGLLCAQMLGVTIKTETQRDEVIQALVEEELLNEESANRLVQAARACKPTQNYCPTVSPTVPRQQQSL